MVHLDAGRSTEFRAHRIWTGATTVHRRLWAQEPDMGVFLNDGPRVFEALDQVSSVRTRMRHANLGCHFLDVECATVSLDLGKELLEQAKTSGNSQPRVVCHGRWSGRSS
ncbi:predicted protein [Plenodomus lingam JN3]|uniref:Predicted protein n=1 Tax=Leptosphaeria maculans (strain JN3 / isolate v23.1.3 / race Av1-4-5-6-7-8) TaxID=985895 RepID=E4ZNH4_LEPMJ|nr:predicted protein [Plenodomus lingam JN3]CBX93033.1 predicted protein [Plenodomus lingam JN3]